LKNHVSREDRMRCYRLSNKLHRHPRLHRFSIRPDHRGRFSLIDLFSYDIVDHDEDLSALESRIAW
jgi:hypothetical protein